MIFTSIAAAALAAVTGMTTIRTPSGTQTTFQEKPDHAIELAIADFSDPRGFYRSLEAAIDTIPSERDPRIDPNSEEAASNRAARKILTTFKNAMNANGFVPEQMLYYNVYNVEEIGKRMNKMMVEVLDHSVIVFADRDGATISFVDETTQKLPFDFMPKAGEHGAYPIKSGAIGTKNDAFKVVAEQIANIGVEKYEHFRAYTKYELMNPGDEFIPEPIWTELFPVIETFDFDKIGIISSLQKVLMSHSIADEVNILSGRDLSAYEHLALDNKVLAGYSMQLALDMNEIAMGQTAINKYEANAVIQEALSLNFGSLMGRNDLNIVY